ncbi:Uncharacterized protein LEKG_1875 [Leuconostoc gasicomitatum KG16-1]|nr:Uncharacterized protein LEKG_1875 [Leuconostoc gasicomitatum KG16-1]
MYSLKTTAVPMVVGTRINSKGSVNSIHGSFFMGNNKT